MSLPTLFTAHNFPSSDWLLENLREQIHDLDLSHRIAKIIRQNPCKLGIPGSHSLTLDGKNFDFNISWEASVMTEEVAKGLKLFCDEAAKQRKESTEEIWDRFNTNLGDREQVLNTISKFGISMFIRYATPPSLSCIDLPLQVRMVLKEDDKSDILGVYPILRSLLSREAPPKS